MTPDSERPGTPLTSSELADLTPGLDLIALQELVDAAPQLRGILLAVLSRSRDHNRIYDAMDEINKKEGRPPVDRHRPEPAAEPKWIQTPGPKGLKFLDEPHYDFQIDFGGNAHLQRLFNRVQGFPRSDA